ncbi:hypothetical protein DICPUDRAFT_97075 [Dictyostelium purpureum]|uniref:RRM domain-containing protein n=1 Tax=Dictyostelium purpureum TaxID=5786 RepID=F0ZDP5_DICPU|nr:uncharacterized protein DICPUDRAFT_97075 [Dictyostelium purpureum]EGC37970.1 hypothetical protein DICPUDRAFT_97075 [Dictyostelium purpureum]|eukprot:XP_003285541.1 hypothetical protein DICPUDRAFT_97075 [Dictyostelium purpureum]
MIKKFEIGAPNPKFDSSPSLLGTPPIIGDGIYDIYSNPPFENKYNNGNGAIGGGNNNMYRGFNNMGGSMMNNGMGSGMMNNGMTNNGMNQNMGNKKFQSVGPNGSNLFVYNIPNYFTDQELSTLFQQYGNVVSAKVYLDKNTGVSKGFGFISYDNPTSASLAISNLNGSMMVGKKLKVSLKQAGHGSQPY